MPLRRQIFGRASVTVMLLTLTCGTVAAQTTRTTSKGGRQAVLIEVPGADEEGQTSVPGVIAPSASVVPTPVPPTSAVESQAIARGPAGGPTSRATEAAPTFNTGRVVLALGIVLGLIFALRFLVRRLFPQAAMGKQSGAVRVLTRSSIAPRQHVVLLQVGRRVLVVGDSAGTMSALGEITDADEVAALIGRLEGETAGVPAGPFSALFGKARQSFDPNAEADPEHPSGPPGNAEQSVNETRTELSGLLDRVKSISKQFKN